MIEKLTKKQQDSLIPFRESWRKIGLSIEEVNREATIKAVTGLYQRLGKKPPLFIFCPSPFWCIQQINFFKFLGKDLKKEIDKASNLRRNLWSNLRRNLGSNLWSNLRSNLESQKTDDELLKELNEYHDLWTYGQMDSAWIGFYQFMETIGITYDKKDSELLELWAQTAKSCSWFWTFENFVFVSDRPRKLSFDEEYRLHDEHGTAYEYSDGWGGYYLHGVNFPKELYLRVISREMPMEEILKIEDIDQRTQAMKFAKTGLRDFYKSQNGTMIDHYVKLDKVGRPINYELWQIPAGEVFDKTVHFAIYDCPSGIERGENKEYSKGVPEFKTIAEAMAWGMSSDDYSISADDWKALIPLIHES